MNIPPPRARQNQVGGPEKKSKENKPSARPPKKKEKDKPQGVGEEDEDFPEPEPAAEQSPDSPEAKRKAELLKTVEALDKKLQAIEYKLVSPALVNSDDKYFVEPYNAYLNLIWLNAEVGTGGGDMAGGADFPPTDTELDTLRAIETEMTDATGEFQKLLKDDLPAFNRVLGDHNVSLVVAAAGVEPDQRGPNWIGGMRTSGDARQR